MTKIFAHRGARGAYPENTLVSFEEAIRVHADGIELDVQLSKDNALIVMHDEKVDRTTDGKGFVADYTLAELKKLDAGSWFDQKFAGEKIPTLKEVVELLQKKRFKGMLNIELKTDVKEYEGIEEEVVALMKSERWCFSYMYSSFRLNSILKIQKLDKKTKIAYVFSQEQEKIALSEENRLIEGFHPSKRWAQAQTKDSVEGYTKKIRCWTMNSKEEILNSFELGLEAIFTDFPEEALRYYKEWRKE